MNHLTLPSKDAQPPVVRPIVTLAMPAKPAEQWEAARVATVPKVDGPSVTHPAAGETVWDADCPSHAEALALANDHWDVCDMIRSGAEAWSVITRGGYCAMVGRIGGRMAILNKETDGSRTLIIA